MPIAKTKKITEIEIKEKMEKLNVKYDVAKQLIVHDRLSREGWGEKCNCPFCQKYVLNKRNEK